MHLMQKHPQLNSSSSRRYICGFLFVDLSY